MATTEELLEPYRGQRGALKRALGIDGLRLLHAHPEVQGSPVAGCEFLGYSKTSARVVTDGWAILGLPVGKRDWARHAAQVERDAYSGELSAADKLSRYIEDTSKPERAPVFDWTLPTKGSDDYARLVTISDIHWGSYETDAARFVRLCDWIGEHPEVRWVGLGDWLNVSTKNSVSSPDLLEYSDACETLLEVVRPIAKQGLMVLDGNHEARIAKELKLKLSPMRELARQLSVGLPQPLHYGGLNEFLRIRLRRGKLCQEYDGYCHHGFGGAATPGGKINYLFRQFSSLACDFLAMGHTHSLTVQEQIRVGLTRRVVSAAGRDYVDVESTGYPLVFAGSFLRHQRGSYARDKGLSPASLGAATLHLYVTEHDVHARQ